VLFQLFGGIGLASANLLARNVNFLRIFREDELIDQIVFLRHGFHLPERHGMIHDDVADLLPPQKAADMEIPRQRSKHEPQSDRNHLISFGVLRLPASHTFTTPSTLAVAILLPSGLKATD
jgi:hypothetical protein